MIASPKKPRPASRDFDPNRSFRLPFLVGVIAVSLAAGGLLFRLFPRAVAPATPFESASMPSRSKSESAYSAGHGPDPRTGGAVEAKSRAVNSARRRRRAGHARISGAQCGPGLWPGWHPYVWISISADRHD